MNKYPISLVYFIDHLLKVPLMTKIPNSEPREQFSNLLIFVQKTLEQIGEANQPLTISLAYLTYREINKFLLKAFEDRYTHFNIVDIYNLHIELKELVNLAQDSYSHLEGKI